MEKYFTSIYTKKGHAPKDSQIASHSHYPDPVDTSKSPRGNSRIWGDIGEDDQEQVIRTIVDTAHTMDVEVHDIAIIVAIAKYESGFNPDAAAATTSASGLGQFTDKTQKDFGLDETNRFDAAAGGKALVKICLRNKKLAQKDHPDDVDTWIYKYHHDGPKGEYGGLELSQQHVVPNIAKIEPIIEKYLNNETPAEESPVQTTLQVSFPTNTGKGIKVDAATVKALYEHTENDTKGGYYPIGANTIWHGGLHLFASEGSDVVACLPGKIIAARLGETEELAKGPIGHSNFILMQHTVKGKPCYSLYMHLQEQPLDESDAFIKKVGWLGKGSGKQLKIAEGKERNYRSSPEVKNDNVLGTLKGGELVDFIEDAPQSPWKKIKLQNGDEVYLSFDAKAVSVVESKEVKADTDLLAKLKEGSVVKIDRQVKCGDLLWKTGSFGPKDYHKGMIHWEIFSSDNLVDCLKNVNPQRSDELPKLTGDTSGYTNGAAIKVRGLTGPSKAIEDEIITLHVDKINFSDAPDSALQKLSWLVKADDKEVDKFSNKGRVLQYTIPTGYMGKTLKIYAFMNEPSEKCCVKVEVLSGWVALEDDVDDFNIDNEKIKTLFGDLLADNVLTRDELVRFYSDNPDGRVEQLRKYACKFSSEWGIPDLDAAISKLKEAGFNAKKENLEPYQWWEAARDAGVDLPESSSVWHYNPISFLEMFGAPPARVAVKSDDLKHGAYDDHGVKNGKGKADGDMHHTATPVKEAQQQLTSMNAYSGAIDGWFYSKMEDAVCSFQKFAEKGMFVIGGVMTTLDEKLSGHQKGVIDDKTKAYMDKVTEKGGKIPDTKDLKPRFPLDKKLRKSLPSYHNDKNGAHRYFGADRKKKDKKGNVISIRKHSGCDLYVNDGTPVYAIDDGVILDHYDFGEAAGHTWVLEVGHNEYTVRYGEIKSALPGGLKIGSQVKRGDHIADVALFPNGEHMLHFEMYKGKNLKHLTDKPNKTNYLYVTPDNYGRRKELMDPTDFLDNLLDE